jgi:hypothetical protein
MIESDDHGGRPFLQDASVIDYESVGNSIRDAPNVTSRL